MDGDGRYVFRKLMANSVFTMSLNTQCVRWSIKLHLNKYHVLFFLRFSATWKGGTLEPDFEFCDVFSTLECRDLHSLDSHMIHRYIGYPNQ
jgi:hypothetical protein